MILILVFLVAFRYVICNMPLEFRKYIESKLIIHNEDYPLFKGPLKSSIKSIFLKEPPKRKIKISTIMPRFITNKQINLDKIIHYLISPNHPKNSKVRAFEADFHNLLGMKGFKYVFKRGNLWRTWREVVDATLKKKILIYRAENNADRTCAECHNRGYWAIEVEPVLCPYEIFSMKDANNVCVIRITHFVEGKQCTEYMQSQALKSSCNNTIITQWRFTKAYDFPERKLPKSSVICEGREKCEITTIYQFQKHQIIFRVVNKENKIIYSRIMKKNEKNFACVDDCGYIHIDTMIIQKTPIAKKLHYKHDQNQAKGDSKNGHYDFNIEPGALNQETAQKLQFKDEQPIIHWKPHGFKFQHTVNQKDSIITNQTNETVTNNDNDIPIARSGDRRIINDDINNNFLEYSTKAESTTKLHCRNIIQDDYYDDISGNAYIDDDGTIDYN